MGNAESFGQVIKARRRELGLTQDELARRVGCAPVTLRKIESDDLRPSVQIAERLAMALVVPLEERAGFVRLARAERAPEPVTPTPAPRRDEIGRADLTGRAIRGYALAERIGQGGMGAVYRAIQPVVEREVAVKIILPQYADDPDFIRRFEGEAQLIARLEHPHIVPLYDYWREPGAAFLIMRLLRGGSAQKLLEAGPLPIAAVSRLVEQMAGALGAAHRAGVVHRDLKPANVLLDEDGNAYLADFGIAKNLSSPDFENFTVADAIVGSPNYISPEQIRSEFVRPQSDIYCLGVMLYELLTGALPFAGPTPIEVMHQHLSAPLPPLAANRPGLPAALDAVIAQATAKDPLARYADADALLTAWRRALGAALDASASLSTPSVSEGPAREGPPLTPADNPYKGLRAFAEGDAPDFFGREALIQQLLIRVGESGDLARFLAVVGPSGSGKSSVVKAGLLPALRRGGLPGSDKWFILSLTPGEHPLEEIEAALLRIAVNPPDSLQTQLREDPRGLLRAIRRCLPDDPEVELVLVIDQFEEVFTLLSDEAERAHLLASLLTAVLDERSRLRLILTLRADFIDRPLNYVDFGEVLRQRMEVVLPLTPDELVRSIVGPGERLGLRWEPGLVSSMLRDVNDQPGALPLLQYALTELFERRDGRTLTRAAYQSLGGVAGALGKRAEQVYAALDAEAQSSARQVFLRLVTLGEGVEDTRRRALRAELESVAASGGGPGVRAVLEAFGRSRLLAFDRDLASRAPTVEVAHEALLREWSRLRDWLADSRADLRQQRQLAQAADEWRASGRNPGFLLSGARLAQFENWFASTSLALTPDERAFYAASLAEGERLAAAERARQAREAGLERRARQVLQALVGVFLLAAVLAGGLAWWANGQRQEADAQRQEAETQRNTAERETARAVSRELAASTIDTLTSDPELSILLALEAVSRTYQTDETVLPEVELALRKAIQASHVEKTYNLPGKVSGQGVSFNQDGSRMATLGADGTVIIWNTETGERLFTMPGHSNPGRNVRVVGSKLIAFSPDGKRLAAVGAPRMVTMWDPVSGQELFSLNLAYDAIALAFSPDGRRLVVGTEGGAFLWDAFTGQEALEVSNYIWVGGVAFSPDGRCLATANRDQVRLWDATTGKLLMPLFGRKTSVVNLAFSPDGTRLALQGEDNVIRIWDANSGDELKTWAVTTEAGLDDLAFSLDGTRLATAQWDGTTTLWNVATGAATLVLRGQKSFTMAAAFHPDGKRLATISEDGTAKLWNITADRELWTLAGHTNLAWTAMFSPDSRHVAAPSWDGTTIIWDVATGQTVFTVRHSNERIQYVRYSPDGSRIATAGQTVAVWDAITGQKLLDLSTATRSDRDSVAFSPDGARLAVGQSDGTITVFDARTGDRLLAWPTENVPITDIVFSPDGKSVLMGNVGTTASVWDAATGQALLKLPGHTTKVTSVGYNPDGTLIATSDGNGSARLWDAVNGKALFALAGHTRILAGLGFSADGKWLATGSWDKTSIIWDLATRQILHIFPSSATINEVAISPNGKYLAAPGTDGLVRIYLISTDDLLALARSRVTRELTPIERQNYLHEPIIASAQTSPVAPTAAPNPTTPTTQTALYRVIIPGTFQAQLGCPDNWSATCLNSGLTLDTISGVWQGVFALPAGYYEYKVALNDSWGGNYGLGAPGSSLPLTVTAPTTVTFLYDPVTHWVADSVNNVLVSAVGDFQKFLGCPANDQPDCLAAWLQDPDGDGVYTFTTTRIPVGSYTVRAAVLAAGAPAGAALTFSIASAGQAVTFRYEAQTHQLTVAP